MRRTLSPHCAFRLGPGTHEEQTHGYPGEAHQQDKPTVICFPPFVCWPRFSRTYPGGPSPCPAHYGRPLATTPPPPSLPYAGMLASPCRARRWGSSPVPIGDVNAIRSGPLYAGCTVKYPWSAQAVSQAGIVPFGSGVSATCACRILRRVERGFLSSA